MQLKIVLTSIVVVGIVGMIAVFLWQRQPELDSVRDTLGRAFNRPAELIELNLPPADGRYPGAVILTPKPGQTLPLRRAYRPAQTPRHTTSIRVSIVDDAQLALANPFIGRIVSAGDVAVDVTLDDLRVFETDLYQLKKDLLATKEAYRAQKRGLNPRVIVKTYEALVSWHIRRGGSLSADVWENIRNKLMGVGGHIIDTGSVTFEGGNPMAIAYETMTVEYVATTLSAGKPDEVELRNALAVNATASELDVSAYDFVVGAPDVRYVTLGNSRYQNEDFANLRAVEPSMQVVERVFKKVGAKPLLTTQFPDVLNESTIDEALSQIIGELRTTTPPLFVLYYVGHAVASRGGALHVVTGDYNGNLQEDLGEDLMVGLLGTQLDEPTSPVKGTHTSDLLDVLTAIQTEAPSAPKGLYPVSMIAKRLEDTGIPFVILVDACFEHAQLERLRSTLNLTQSGDYYGPGAHGGPAEERRYSSAVRQFGAAPYLRSANVVIFSATPGTVARVVPDPRPTWGSIQHVGPLALRIHRQFETAVAQTESLTWGDFVQSMVDVKTLGELRVRGTVSWSDFSVVSRIPMLQKDS